MGPVAPLIGPDAVVEIRPSTADADAGHGRRGADEDEGWSALLESVTSRASSPSGDPIRNSLTTQGRQGQVRRSRGRPWPRKARREGGVPKSDGTKPDLVDASGSEELGRRGSGVPDMHGASLPGRGGVDVEAPASSVGSSLVGSSCLVEPVSASTGQGPKCAALKSSKKGRKSGVKPMDGEIIINSSGLEVSENLERFPTMKAWLIANGHEDLANTPRPDMTHAQKNEYHRLYQHYQSQRRKHLADCSQNVRPSSEREGESDLVPGVPRLLDWLKAIGHADLAMTRQKDRTPAQKRLYSNLYYRYVSLKQPKHDLMQQEASRRGIHQRRRNLEDYVLARVSADAPLENPVGKQGSSKVRAAARGTLSQTSAGARCVAGATSACKGPMDASNDEEDSCRKKRSGRKGKTGPKNGLSTPTAEAGCEMVDE